jgi:CRP/FNR family transcriptional regulator, cyclic AMP receptor protein
VVKSDSISSVRTLDALERTNLGALDLFAGVPESDLAALTGGLPILDMAIGEGWKVIDAAACVVILSGRVALDVATSDQRMRTIALLDPGDVIVGAAAPWSTVGPEVHSRAAEASRLLLIGAERLDQWLAIPPLASNLVRILAAQVADRELAVSIALEPRLEERLLLKIEHLAARWGRVTPDGVRLDLRLTHQELAEMIGAVRESVTIALGHLVERGELEVRNRTILLRGRK